MTETAAVVVREEGEFALVEVEAGAGCGRCDSVKGCHGATLGKLFCAVPRRFRVLNRVRARPGERVVLGVGEGAVARSAGAVYGLPLLFLAGGAVIGAGFAEAPGMRDLYAFAGSMLGLLAGVAGSRAVSGLGGGDPGLLPRILRRA